MSTLAIVFILFAVAMMLGPVLLLQPSKRQQRIASLRREAAVQGLRVRLLSEQGQPLAAYEHPWQGKSKNIRTWGLLRKSYEHGLHIAKYWQWLDQNRPSADVEQQLHDLLLQLPQDVDRVVAEQTGVFCGWAEKGGQAELQVICQVLAELTTPAKSS